jgi:hypothetical protein
MLLTHHSSKDETIKDEFLMLFAKIDWHLPKGSSKINFVSIDVICCDAIQDVQAHAHVARS